MDNSLTNISISFPRPALKYQSGNPMPDPTHYAVVGAGESTVGPYWEFRVQLLRRKGCHWLRYEVDNDGEYPRWVKTDSPELIRLAQPFL